MIIERGPEEHPMQEQETEVLIPTNRELFQDSKFSKQIEDAVERSRASQNENCFLAAINPETNLIIINDLFEGSSLGIKLDYPSLGQDEYKHPERKGFHLSPDYHPYFEFHSHTDDPSQSVSLGPSPKDLYHSFNLAKQNFNIASREAVWWVNPLFLIVHPNKRCFVYQINPRMVEKFGNEADWLFQFAKGCLSQLEGKKKLSEEEKEELEASRTNPIMLFAQVDLEKGKVDPLYGYPDKLNDKDLSQALQAAGIQNISFSWRGQKDFREKIEDWSIIQKYEI